MTRHRCLDCFISTRVADPDGDSSDPILRDPDGDSTDPNPILRDQDVQNRFLEFLELDPQP